MSDPGGYEVVEGDDDVDRRISEHDIETILTGGIPADPSLDALATLIRTSDFDETVPERVASRHVAAAASAAARADHRLPTAANDGRRRRLLFRGALSGLTAKILFGTAVALAATGGAAATGILPDPIQSVLADGASHFGIELPHPREATTTTTTTTAATTTAATTTTTDPDDEGSSALPGSYIWESTACAGDPISVAYTVSANGELALGAIAGDPENVDATTDRIEVRFTDGIRIQISIDGNDEAPGIEEGENRDCGNDLGDGDDPSGGDGSDGDESGDPSDNPDSDTPGTDDPSDPGDEVDVSDGGDTDQPDWNGEDPEPDGNGYYDPEPDGSGSDAADETAAD